MVIEERRMRTEDSPRGRLYEALFATAFVATPYRHPVIGWRSDVELATIPCAYGTAENMVHRAAVGGADRVLVTGASGGVGSATVQLARRRGAEVVAIAGRSKLDAVRSLGVEVIARGADLLAELGESSIDVVIDNVALAKG